MSTQDAALPPQGRGRRSRWPSRTLMALGACLVIAGIAVIAVPVITTYMRGHADDQALQQWRSGGAAALAGPPISDVEPGSSTAPSCRPNSAPAGDYALLTFPTLAKYGYQGVAGNGDWNMLHQRSMVHYSTSAAPGAEGNVIVAFHREPHYEHIDQLQVGDTVTVQDRSCTTFTYRITQRWTLYPDKVTQLTNTPGQHDLTLITCTPWWRDYERIVWRAALVPDASPATQ